MSDAAIATAIGKLRGLLAEMKKSAVWTQIVEPRDGVYARFQPVFCSANVAAITAEEFKPFLYFEHNHHWTGLHRHVNRLCADMPKLRQALLTLLEQNHPVSERLDSVAGAITGLGKGITTAILHVAYPSDYGVWNNTSEGALSELGIYPDFARGASVGARYASINDLLNRLAQSLQIDLWTLDALWWMLREGGELPLGAPPTQSELASPIVPGAHAFGLERHLHDFMFDNWDRLDLGREWMIYGTPGDEDAGYEFACSVGRIDILARHRTQRKWLIIELKRESTTDAVVGQALRYMGWVRQHLAEKTDEVHGLIIAREGDPSLQYAISIVPNLTFQVYEVEFRLQAPAPLLAAS